MSRVQKDQAYVYLDIGALFTLDVESNVNPEIRVVLNWFDELKRLAPVK